MTTHRFVLKGGTLLYHVFKSPRASFKDADYAYTAGETNALTTPKLAETLTIDIDGFHLYGNDAQWRVPLDIFEGNVPFSIEAPRLRVDDDKMKITVSVREAEQLDPPTAPLFYEDKMLYGDQIFRVNGLSRDELAAEKILAWTLRELTKHYLDLAILARDHHPHLDLDKVVWLVRRKFSVESKAESTRSSFTAKQIDRASKITTVFQRPGPLRQMERDWDEAMIGDFRLLEDEIGRTDSLFDINVVKELVAEVWHPVLAKL
jgi:predicted nucleotidyltransferase component of viral defense system